MASVQARRENISDEGGVFVGRDRVPKMATRFESLAGKARDDQVSSGTGESESERKRREEGEAEKVGFVSKVAAGVKDQAAVVGLGTTQYTLEKVAEATKAVADMTSTAAGYTGEKVVVAKDKVAGVGMTAVRYAGEKIAATTDAVVAAEEKAAEYAAEKQAEARALVEARRASHSHEIVEESEAAPEIFMWEEDGQSGSILGAIGEMIVEIGQTAKLFLMWLNPIQQKDEAEFRKEH